MAFPNAFLGVLMPEEELRAALICLLTAALAARGAAAVIGDVESGWIWLPPCSLWQPWAAQGLDGAVKQIVLKPVPVLDRSFAVGP
ncbi:MAG TPA: hypothetical protein VGD78_08985 [Chthoniobacterales bacterium]